VTVEHLEFSRVWLADTDIAIQVSRKLEVVPLGCIVAPHFLSTMMFGLTLLSFLMFLNESFYQR